MDSLTKRRTVLRVFKYQTDMNDLFSHNTHNPNEDLDTDQMKWQQDVLGYFCHVVIVITH